MYECVQLLCCLIDVFFFGKLLDVSLSENLRNIFLTKIPARPRCKCKTQLVLIESRFLHLCIYYFSSHIHNSFDYIFTLVFVTLLLCRLNWCVRVAVCVDDVCEIPSTTIVF
jgi:hypothetical protein